MFKTYIEQQLEIIIHLRKEHQYKKAWDILIELETLNCRDLKIINNILFEKSVLSYYVGYYYISYSLTLALLNKHNLDIDKKILYNNLKISKEQIKYHKKTEIKNTTLLAVSSIKIDETLNALKFSSIQVNFEKVIFFTDHVFTEKELNDLKLYNISIVNIEKLDYVNYSRFMIYDLYKYIDTEYVLIIQYDGYIINPYIWDDNYYKYDYIGATWRENFLDCRSIGVEKSENRGIGNGGFTFRSKKLLEIPDKYKIINRQNWSDDVFYCKYVDKLKEYGCVLPDIETQNNFSIETIYLKNSFGFHSKDIWYYNILKNIINFKTYSSELVVAYYNEDINWININDFDKIKIYDKGNNLDNKFETIKLENIGRETHTYIYHIIENYDNLSDLTFFTQGNPFDHCQDFKEKIKLFIQTWYSNTHDCDITGAPEHNGLNIKEIADELELNIDDNITFKSGSIFSIYKDEILKHDKSYYINMLNVIKKYKLSPWVIERLWGYIFNNLI